MKMICDVPDEVINSVRMGTWCGSSVAEKMIANGTPIPDNATMLSVTEWADRCRECGSEQGRKLEQIRAEIEDKRNVAGHFDTKTARAQVLALSWVLDLIDKYTKGESE